MEQTYAGSCKVALFQSPSVAPASAPRSSSAAASPGSGAGRLVSQPGEPRGMGPALDSLSLSSFASGGEVGDEGWASSRLFGPGETARRYTAQ